MPFIGTTWRNMFWFLVERIYSEYVYWFGIGRSYEKEDTERGAAYVHHLIRNATDDGQYKLHPFLSSTSFTGCRAWLGFIKVKWEIKFSHDGTSGLKTLKQAEFSSLTIMKDLMHINTSLRAGPFDLNSWVIMSFLGFEYRFFVKGTLSHAKFFCDFTVDSKTHTSGTFNYLSISEVKGVKLWIEEGLGLLKWPVNLAILLVITFFKPFIRNAAEYLLTDLIKNEFPNHKFPIEGNVKETSLSEKSHEKHNADNASSDLKRKPPVGFKDSASSSVDSQSKAKTIKYKPIVIGGKTFKPTKVYIRISTSKNVLKMRRISETEYKGEKVGNTEINESKNETNSPSVKTSHSHKTSDYQSAMIELQLRGYSGIEFKKFYDESTKIVEALKFSSITMKLAGSLICLLLIETFLRDERTGEPLEEVELRGARKIHFIKKYNEARKLVKNIQISSNTIKQFGSLFCQLAIQRYMAYEFSKALDEGGSRTGIYKDKTAVKSEELAKNLPVTSVGQGCVTSRVSGDEQDNKNLSTSEISSANSLGQDQLKDARPIPDFNNPLTVMERNTINKERNLYSEKYFSEKVVNRSSSTLGVNTTAHDLSAGEETKTCESEDSFVDLLFYSSMMPKSRKISTDVVERNVMTRVKNVGETVPVAEKTGNPAAICEVTAIGNPAKELLFSPEINFKETVSNVKKIQNYASLEREESDTLDINQCKALIEAMEKLVQIVDGRKVLLLRALKVLNDVTKTFHKPGKEKHFLVNYKIKQMFAAVRQTAVEEFVKSGGDYECIKDVKTLLESCMQFSDSVDEAEKNHDGSEGLGGQNLTKISNQCSNDASVDMLFWSLPKSRKLSTNTVKHDLTLSMNETSSSIDSVNQNISENARPITDLDCNNPKTVMEESKVYEKVNLDIMETFFPEKQAKTYEPEPTFVDLLHYSSVMPKYRKGSTKVVENVVTGVEVVGEKVPIVEKMGDSAAVCEVTTKENQAEEKLPREAVRTKTYELEAAVEEEGINRKLSREARTEHSNEMQESSDLKYIASEEICAEDLPPKAEMAKTCKSDVSSREEYTQAKLPFETEVEQLTTTNESVDATTERDSKEKLLEMGMDAICEDGVSFQEKSAQAILPFEAEIEPVADTVKSIDVTAENDVKEKLLEVEMGATCEAKVASKKECASAELSSEAEIEPVASTNKYLDVIAARDSKEKLFEMEAACEDGVSYQEKCGEVILPFEAEIEPVAATNKSIDVIAETVEETLLKVEVGAICEAQVSSKEECAPGELPFEAEVELVSSTNEYLNETADGKEIIGNGNKRNL